MYSLTWRNLGYNRFMRILPPVEEEIRGVIRDARAKDPLISVSGLEKTLEEHFQRGFSHQYVSKIADKVARKGLMEAGAPPRCAGSCATRGPRLRPLRVPSSGSSLPAVRRR